jgi:hypothetical protein
MPGQQAGSDWLMSGGGHECRFGPTSDASGHPPTTDVWANAGFRRCGPLPDLCIAANCTSPFTIVELSIPSALPTIVARKRTSCDARMGPRTDVERQHSTR